MKVRVVNDFIDKETRVLHTAGRNSIITVSKKRYEEIKKAGHYVVPVEENADALEHERMIEVAETEPAFENMTVAELKDYADEHDIDLGSVRKKDEIIETIRTAVK